MSLFDKQITKSPTAESFGTPATAVTPAPEAPSIKPVA